MQPMNKLHKSRHMLEDVKVFQHVFFTVTNGIHDGKIVHSNHVNTKKRINQSQY
jgi:hypothetical protein